ncbi:uncharacterized protein LOC109541608 isoform X1 [Dendroctonus ponderosae]|uniref:Uncharacterized protein n=1 Tax=Dendroctonus ponderosae TaxID=77166 RepID=U4ULU4_DENPD|nr:uncharacterized protein LOC109541608 isoform X1 [Dendroctonus ponderosae]ERL90970.1 hypothetical protein D910_08312 [Dendroctonus ponderosae]KAH1028651.1 hypothetical protein HUJ05_001988 [Dendroctonus ponderosae]
MMALKVLPIAQLLLILFTDLVLCYPSGYYSSKRYRQTHRPAAYDPYDYYSRSQRYPFGYYPSYSQLYPEEYYYSQDGYSPVYYVAPRSAKYDYYQSALPYSYRQEVPASRSKYNYYNDADQAIEDPEKLLQDYEREQRERSQPIGHEIRYETDYGSDDDSTLADTSAAFLNNLMMQQMYQDAQQPSKNSYDYSAGWNDMPYDRAVALEDQEVEELKELPKKQKERKARQRKQRKQRINNDTPSKRSESSAIVFTDRKPVVKEEEEAPRRDTRGQKEEVLMRPATPVRHPFSNSVLDMMNRQEERKRSPSVYEQIKQMLEMDKNDEKQSIDEDVRPSMKKRIVSSEDSLTRQLSVLKTTH